MPSGSGVRRCTVAGKILRAEMALGSSVASRTWSARSQWPPCGCAPGALRRRCRGCRAAPGIPGRGGLGEIARRHHPALLQRHQMRGQRRGIVDTVGHHQHGQIQALCMWQQHLDKSAAARPVQGREGFIQQTENPGAETNARASATRLFSPPERLRTGRSSKAAMSKNCADVFDRRRASRRAAGGIGDVLADGEMGKSRASWNTRPMPRRCGGKAERSPAIQLDGCRDPAALQARQHRKQAWTCRCPKVRTAQ